MQFLFQLLCRYSIILFHKREHRNLPGSQHKRFFSVIFSLIFSLIISVTAETWREWFGKADGQIDIAVCQLEFRFGKATFLAEVEDVGDASAPGFHQAALEEDFTDELVDGFGLWPLVEGFGRCAGSIEGGAAYTQTRRDYCDV